MSPPRGWPRDLELSITAVAPLRGASFTCRADAAQPAPILPFILGDPDGPTVRGTARLATSPTFQQHYCDTTVSVTLTLQVDPEVDAVDLLRAVYGADTVTRA